MVKCSGMDYSSGKPVKCKKLGNCKKQKRMENYKFVDPSLVHYFGEHDMCWDY